MSKKTDEVVETVVEATESIADKIVNNRPKIIRNTVLGGIAVIVVTGVVGFLIKPRSVAEVVVETDAAN